VTFKTYPPDERAIPEASTRTRSYGS